MTFSQTVKQYQAEILLGAILLLSAFLNIWNVWNQGFTNTYYAAAVRSMLENPGMALFNAFDAAGFVTIDKPPVGLWVQAVSALLFGFSGWALVLPQALAGVGSVGLVYAIVSRPFGKAAGLVSALALAVTPIIVAVSRNGTMDGLLIFVLILSLWVACKAAREQSLPLLLVSVILIGIGFNIKMIQAFIVVPAVLVIYALGTRGQPRTRQALHLGLALLVLATVSLSWAVAIDMVPADQRPYIGGSGDNTVLGLIINYNGLHRLENGAGTGGDPGGIPMGTGAQPGGQNRTSFMTGMPQNRTAVRPGDGGDTAAGMMASPGRQDQGVQGQQPSPMTDGQSSSFGDPSQPGGRNGGGMDETGTPGISRLFGAGLAGQISWLLPFALVGLVAWWRRPASLSLAGLKDAGLFSERGLVLLAAWLWLLPGLLYFSFTTGFWHTYYLATIAPPLAMVVGISALGLYEAYGSGGMRGWLLVGAVAVTGLIQVLFLSYSEPWSGPLVPVLLAGVVVFSILLAVLKFRNPPGTGYYSRVIAAAAIAILFLATTVWAVTPLVSGNSGNLPVAGPQVNRGGAGMGNTLSETGNGTSRLAEYLLSHQTGETWIVAVPSSNSQGAGLIIETGEAVMSLGGFSGSDQILTVNSLKRLIDAGRIRYFLGSGIGSGGGTGGGNAEIFTWVSDHCAVVPAADWGGSSAGTTTVPLSPVAGNTTAMDRAGFNTTPGRSSTGPGGDQNTLYDCAGYIGQTST
jgi:4-amino-4-deoxy-L-arabinose transferase-like glycosyltransferase